MEKEREYLYANATEVGVSPYEISVKFMRQGTPSTDLSAPAGQRKQVKPELLDTFLAVMSPGLAKALVATLYLGVKNYEETIGPIVMPSEVQAVFTNVFGKPTAK